MPQPAMRIPGSIGYYEASMGWNQASTTGNNGFPSFWLYDINGFNSGNYESGR
jgi:hypothetical protein